LLGVTLRNLAVRRQRTALTALAVFVGVSMVCGTFVFTDTIRTAFRHQFANSATGAAVVISSREDVSSAISAPATIPVSLVLRIRRVHGVAAAQGQVRDVATIVGRNGKPIESLGAPTVAVSYIPPPFTGLTFVAGTRPRGSGEVAIDEATAERQHYRLGETVPIVTGQPERRFRISGIVRYGTAALGGSPLVVFDLGTARGLYGKQSEVDLVYVAATKGTAPAALVNEIRPLLPSQLVVRTTPVQVNTDLQRVSSQLSLITGGLLAFGLIAVLIGAFVIFNTFSITISRRTREFALLRALGATRGQVLAAVLAEATTVGLLASVLGLGGGLGAAAVIRALFSASGHSLPSAGLVLAGRTVLIGLAVGVLVPVLAGLLPAWRATRVAPLEALRAAQAPGRGRGRRSWARVVAIVPPLLLAAGGAVVAFALGGPTTSGRLTASAVGAVMLVLAVVAAVPAVIGRFGAVVARPLERGGSILPRLARENAARHPARTAISASGLMIGLALVLFVTVYANGLRSSTREVIARTVLGDFTIENQSGTGLVPAASARAAAQAPGAIAVSTLRTAPAQIGHGGTVNAVGIDPTTFSDVYRFDWVHGSAATIANLTVGQVLVERDTARGADLHVGEHVMVTTETGLRTSVTVAGIYRDQALLRGFALPLAQFNQLFHQEQLSAVFVKLGPGASRAAAAAALRQALRPFPGIVVRSQQQLKNEAGSRVDSLLLLFYALLAMTVLLALLGIVNTLTLSIYERTSELGMLRAIGMTPDQARGMIRAESIITGVIGTIVGIVVGLAVAWIITRALTDQGIVFAVPWLQVAVLLVLGLLAGVVAAVLPAARAARIDVLAAIAHD
jgi:putative ABC transport system permease protein